MSMSLTRRSILCMALSTLAACGGTFRTSFTDPVASAVSRGWRIVDVRVDVPETLVVSEARTLLPRADIVWREDPGLDRKPQVAKIIADSARAAAQPLHGARPVVLDVTLSRFHALTFEAETRLSSSGVHDIEFTLSARDARTGDVLRGPDHVEASLPAYSGKQMVEMRARGETQKSQIMAHLRATFAAWLGVGPDNRGTFKRLGG